MTTTPAPAHPCPTCSRPLGPGATLVKTESGIVHATCAMALSWENVNDLNRASELFMRRGQAGKATAKRLDALAATISNLLLRS
jgi:hypothetical protein